MLCCQYPLAANLGDTSFTMDASRVTFGRGCLGEVGERVRGLGLQRVALFTDATLAKLSLLDTVLRSLKAAGLDVVVYNEVRVEPTNLSFEEAARFAVAAGVDGYVSLGGGSVIDTCKAANLLASHPAPLHAYVNPPVGEGRAVKGPLAPHIACPTTSGTGSEVTGIAIFDDLTLGAKTGIASPRLRPTEALVDPNVTASLPAQVVAASGLDVLCHAVESFTARPYNQRQVAEPASARPMSQGRNPFSDIGCREALTLTGRYLLRAVRDAADAEAREGMLWAATLAGVAFGNAGVHLPHAMAYAVAGLAHETSFHPSDYPGHEPMVPHGVSVIVGAPSVFRFTAPVDPARHQEAARRLGADVSDSDPTDAGELLAGRLIALMREASLPNGVGGIGYRAEHVQRLVAGTLPQARLLANAPRPVGASELTRLFQGAMSYW